MADLKEVYERPHQFVFVYPFRAGRQAERYCLICGGFANIDAPSECPNRAMMPYEALNVRDLKLDLYGGVWLWEYDEIVPTPFVGLN